MQKTPVLNFSSQNLSLQEKTNSVWFHRTSFSCCEKICKYVIDVDCGRKHQDFSPGKEFSQSFEKSIEWAAGRDMKQSK